MTETNDCLSCSFSRQAGAPVRERVYLSERWRAAHAFGTALPGWLVVMPRRHVTALDELTVEEASELGVLLRALSLVLREVTGCAKTYVALFAEAEGFSHVHFHVIPRDADLAPDLRGPRVFDLLGVGSSRQVTEQARDEISAKLSTALASHLT